MGFRLPMAFSVQFQIIHGKSTVLVVRKNGIVFHSSAIFQKRLISAVFTISYELWDGRQGVKGTLSPLEIFHKVDMVGFPSPRSICASMLLLTPLSFASSPCLIVFLPQPFCIFSDNRIHRIQKNLSSLLTLYRTSCIIITH